MPRSAGFLVSVVHILSFSWGRTAAIHTRGAFTSCQARTAKGPAVYRLNKGTGAGAVTDALITCREHTNSYHFPGLYLLRRRERDRPEVGGIAVIACGYVVTRQQRVVSCNLACQVTNCGRDILNRGCIVSAPVAAVAPASSARNCLVAEVCLHRSGSSQSCLRNSREL
ncbi:hypothetical protein B0T20DRAFT_254156 [Sordaria brevicollis]|uniref:Secreted protein n=1 Tax=Sordaria brevicollis TaxID=83679 RepID=A0AAE0UAW3_SORBR|nr:hypothetical protein B0T20DRAFT_254156 [Sordaria brevicollis]